MKSIKDMGKDWNIREQGGGNGNLVVDQKK